MSVPRVRRRSPAPRRFAAADIVSFARPATNRLPRPSASPHDGQEAAIWAELRRAYPLRTRRLQRDLRWLRREARKRGVVLPWLELEEE